MDYTKPFRYISEIAKYQSISTAADKLDISQPSLSKYLKKVETELGTELFDRSTTPLKITQAGKYYLETAAKVIDADNQMQKQMSGIIGHSIAIHIGISPSRAPYLLPEIIRKFQVQMSETSVVIHEGNTDELCEWLSCGRLDLVISLKSNSTTAFSFVKMLDETVMLAVPNFCTDISSDLEKSLMSLPIIAPGKGQILSNILSYFPHCSSRIECQNIITALSMVEAGLGAAFVPSYMADFNTDRHIRYIRIPKEIEEKSQREVCIFFRASQILNRAEQCFIDIANSVFAKKRGCE